MGGFYFDAGFTSGMLAGVSGGAGRKVSRCGTVGTSGQALRDCSVRLPLWGMGRKSNGIEDRNKSPQPKTGDCTVDFLSCICYKVQGGQISSIANLPMPAAAGERINDLMATPVRSWQC
jgi:hypothetical protein